MSRNGNRNLLVLLLSVVVVLLAGWVSGYFLQVIVSALLAYVLWHFGNLARLHHWLQNPESDTPRSYGLWSDIFDEIASLERHSVKQKEKYAAMLRDFQALADAFPDATLVIDDDGRLNWFNTAAKKFFGLRDPEHIGRRAGNRVRFPGFQDWLDHSSASQTELKKATIGENDRWMELSSVRIRGDWRLVILRDISEVRNVERIRRDFVTNVSHELRTPLTVMLGYLEVFLHSQPENIDDAMQRMHAQAVQMQTMLDDFLELSRIQTAETEAEELRVDVPDMLEKLKEQAEEISRGNHVLQFEVDNSLFISGVAADLESAFRNLIVNALKYTQEGGTVAVNWSDTPEGPTLEVSDTGIGIPNREIPRLTERFYRVNSDRGRQSGGTGLGLAIVKHVLNTHQAQLRIQSEFGVGSRFSCVFPVKRRQNQGL